MLWNRDRWFDIDFRVGKDDDGELDTCSSEMRMARFEFNPVVTIMFRGERLNKSVSVGDRYLDKAIAPLKSDKPQKHDYATNPWSS